MGASGWHYFVPYDSDVARALAALRAKVFASGDYYRPRRGKRPRTVEDLVAACAESGTHCILDVSRVLAEPLPVPELRAARLAYERGAPLADDETRRLSRQSVSVHGAVGRLADDVVREVFGSSSPDHTAAEQAYFAAFEHIPRGAGAYVVVFSAGQPSELLFVGKTGD
jgi:hypothetical protein